MLTSTGNQQLMLMLCKRITVAFDPEQWLGRKLKDSNESRSGQHLSQLSATMPKQ